MRSFLLYKMSRMVIYNCATVSIFCTARRDQTLKQTRCQKILEKGGIISYVFEGLKMWQDGAAFGERVI
jgi:hypothetical protein